MIRINLLELTRPTAVSREAPTPTGARQAVIFLGALLVAFGLVGFLYQYWSREVSRLETDLKKEKAEQARLAAIRAENQRYEQQRRQLEMRINTIQTLQESRVGPVEMMTVLGAMVNRTDNLYLLNVTPGSGRLLIKGLAFSVESIAKFIAVLKRSGTFSDVQLLRYYQDDMKERAAYKFDLDCAYKGPAPPGAPTAPATTTGRAGK